MKKKNRVKLYCWKRLHSGVLDKFTVVVNYSVKEEAKKKYEDMGYRVLEA